VGAEGQVEVNQFAARGADVGLHLTEDGDICLAEAVDGLLRVADDEKICDFRFTIFDWRLEIGNW